MKNPYKYPGILKTPYTLKRLYPCFDFTNDGYSKAKKYLNSIDENHRFHSLYLDEKTVVILIANHLKLYETAIGNYYTLSTNGVTTHLLKDGEGRIIYSDDFYNADGTIKYFIKRPERTRLYFIPIGGDKNIEVPVFIPRRFTPPNP